MRLRRAAIIIIIIVSFAFLFAAFLSILESHSFSGFSDLKNTGASVPANRHVHQALGDSQMELLVSQKIHFPSTLQRTRVPMRALELMLLLPWMHLKQNVDGI